MRSKIKRICVCAVFLILICAFGISTVSAASIPQILKMDSDGLYAEIIPEDTDTGLDISFKLNNAGFREMVNIVLDFTIPEGFELKGDGTKVDSIPSKEEKILKFSISPIGLEADTEAETDEISEEDKDSSLIYVIIAAAVIAVIVIAVLIVKHKKAATACILLFVLFLGVFSVTVPIEAEEIPGGKFNMSCALRYGGEKYPVYVEVSYSYVIPPVTEADGMGDFEITYYYGPHGMELCNEENIKMIAECGFTSVPVEGGSPSVNKKALELLRKYGLKCSGLHDERISNAIELALSERNDKRVDKMIETIVKDYGEYMDVIDGWWLRDEPSAGYFEALGKVVKAFKKYNPENISLVNLFPDYASAEQLGTETYQEYLDRFIEKSDPSFVSYDYYHFGNGVVREGFFTNMESVRTTSLASDLEYMLIVLLTEHYGYADLSFDQIEWEVNMCLTYGMKRVSYFTYWLDSYLLSIGWKNSCVASDGTVYQHYYDVQAINKWLLPLGRELFGKTSEAVFHVNSDASLIEENCTGYTEYGALGKVNADNFVIGFFDDGSFMISNKSYVSEPMYDDPFEFLDVKSGLEYFNTDKAEWRDAESDGIVERNVDGNFVKFFNAAEGMLFRVKK